MGRRRGREAHARGTRRNVLGTHKQSCKKTGLCASVQTCTTCRLRTLAKATFRTRGGGCSNEIITVMKVALQHNTDYNYEAVRDKPRAVVQWGQSREKALPCPLREVKTRSAGICEYARALWHTCPTQISEQTTAFQQTHHHSYRQQVRICRTKERSPPRQSKGAVHSVKDLSRRVYLPIFPPRRP